MKSMDINGTIKEISEKNGKKYGFILGMDNNKYYFNGDRLSKGLKMDDLTLGQWVSFNVSNSSARKVRLNDVLVLPEDDTPNDVDHERIAAETMYYYPGHFNGEEWNLMKQRNLKDDSDEEIVLDKLAEVIYISRVGHHFFSSRGSRYEFCLAGATEFLKQYIRTKSEFIIVMSWYKNGEWQQRTLSAEREIRRRREISERRPLVNFYILISNANDLKEQIDGLKGSTSAAIIPFTFEEIIECKNAEALQRLILSRFGEYLFENNMLGETNAIDDDNLLFGDRGKIADSIVRRCEDGNYSGIFGLRRSGKSSVLNAVIRRLERNGICYVKIESRSMLETLDSWRTALFDIAKRIREKTLGYEKEDGETQEEYTRRLRLSSTERDYEKRAAQLFVEDVKLYCKDYMPFVIAIDEVELIVYNSAKQAAWKSLEAYSGFWGALRDCGCPLIISGVNSTLNEKNTISYRGEEGDNPMYGRIMNCAEASKTYLPSFTDDQTKVMLNTLGGFSNIGFSNVYAMINRAFGGQPYEIRQFGSYLFEHVKEHRKLNKVYEVDKATTERLLSDYSKSVEGVDLCKIILQHLKIYEDEYEILKNIALYPEKFIKINSEDKNKIDHLCKYGLVEYAEDTGYLVIRIKIIEDYFRIAVEKDPLMMSQNERRRFVQDYLKICEEKLKTYVYRTYKYSGKEADGIIAIAKLKPNDSRLTRLSFKELFDHTKFVLFFSDVCKLITDNWNILGVSLTSVGINKRDFDMDAKSINKARTDADHVDTESSTESENGIPDNVIRNFVMAKNELDRFLYTID